jgi:NADH:ubiquinone oxidoreductase subunit H
MTIPPTELQHLLIKSGATIKATSNPGRRNHRSTIQLRIGPYSAQTQGSIADALADLLKQISREDLETRVGDRGK